MTIPPIIDAVSGSSYRQAIQTVGAIDGRRDVVQWFILGPIIFSGMIVKVAGSEWRLLRTTARLASPLISGTVTVDIVGKLPGESVYVSLLEAPLVITVGNTEATGGGILPSKRILPVGTLVKLSMSTGEGLLVMQNLIGSSPQTYELDCASLSSGIWTKQEDGASISQDLVANLKNLGGNIYRIVATSQVSSTYDAMVGQLQRSSDGGFTWSDVGPTPKESTSKWGVTDVDIAPDGTLWLCTNSAINNSDAGYEPEIHKSVDDGLTWSLVYEETTKTLGLWEHMWRLSCHPTDSDIIGVQGDTAISLMRYWHTLNGAAPFTRNTGSAGTSVAKSYISIIWDNGRVLHIRGDVPHISDDYGASSWTAGSSLFSNGQFLFSMVRGNIDGHAYACGGSVSDGQNIERTKDYGVTWEELTDEDDFDSLVSRLHGLAYDTTLDILYMVTIENEPGGVTDLRVFALDNASNVNASDVGNQIIRPLTHNLDDLFNEFIAPRGIALTGAVTNPSENLTVELHHRVRAVGQ